MTIGKLVYIAYILMFIIFALHSLNANVITNHRIVVPDDVKYIQQAISIASDGGEIIVKKSGYAEYIIISKPLKLTGVDFPTLYEQVIVMRTSDVAINGFVINVIPPGTEAGVIIVNATNVVVEDIIFTGTGILVYNSKNVVIKNCTFIGNPGPAIKISGASMNITIEWSSINNTYAGLFVEQGESVVFRYNTVETKNLAVKLGENAKEVLIYLNNFISTNVEDRSINSTWHNPKLKLGNYWTGLGGIDADLDGIIDTPVSVQGRILDPYPLSKPFFIYLNNTITAVNDENLFEEKPSENHILLYVVIFVVALIAVVTLVTILKGEE